MQELFQSLFLKFWGKWATNSTNRTSRFCRYLPLSHNKCKVWVYPLNFFIFNSNNDCVTFIYEDQISVCSLVYVETETFDWKKFVYITMHSKGEIWSLVLWF